MIAYFNDLIVEFITLIIENYIFRVGFYILFLTF